MSVYHGYSVPQRLEERIRSSETRVTGVCKLPYGCWESNPGSLEEQPVFSSAESRLQPHPRSLNDLLCAHGVRGNLSKCPLNR